MRQERTLAGGREADLRTRHGDHRFPAADIGGSPTSESPLIHTRLPTRPGGVSIRSYSALRMYRSARPARKSPIAQAPTSTKPTVLLAIGSPFVAITGISSTNKAANPHPIQCATRPKRVRTVGLGLTFTGQNIARITTPVF